MEGFSHADRRLAFALGRTAARDLLARATGEMPAYVRLDIAADGAPVAPEHYVSIAHTGRGAAVLGVAAVASVPVGIDAEVVAVRRPDLWKRLLAPTEYDVLNALGGPTDGTQTLLWALKEAVLKGQRTGFRAGARSIVLSVPEGTAEEGHVRAVADQSGAWEVAYAHLGSAVVTVAWQEAP
ncbi:MAG TPA: 4'-phosphopantetheinyl transferase superfamily protein [Rubricoccaceae bacterium]